MDVSNNFRERQIAPLGLAGIERQQIARRYLKRRVVRITEIGIDTLFWLPRVLDGGKNLLHCETIAGLPVLSDPGSIVTHILDAKVWRRIGECVQV
ncbi:hypothetical protein VI26_02190 [Chromobacterium sp. LK1]|nr:hypothetical protein VI26_02190 [Chromobacterium sp. LK1]